MASFILGNWWALMFCGLLVGVFAGLFGLGGGAVLVPLLVLIFGMGQKLAHGTSLAIILSPAAAPAIWRYHEGGYVDWRVVLAFAPSMLVGSYVGAWIATHPQLHQHYLKLGFAFILTYVAAYMILSRMADLRWAVGLSLIPSAVLLAIAIATGTLRVEPPGQIPGAAVGMGEAQSEVGADESREENSGGSPRGVASRGGGGRGSGA